MRKTADDLPIGKFDTMTRLNLVSILIQAGNALRKGNRRQAALLFGAATIAPRYRLASYVVQGGITLNNLRKRLR
ncbi:hypothetical protein [Halorarum salinum]|uniref:Uncharacterized protein n=1 Tax=Halorarum salinum TaxID=2743089 RepID=A0A7D5L8T3_9EURY|nr:hypothetical protein [Halobaculum salinum]QLG60692.1 hypothetical protein HUG12_02605 [Halobaculum salinum]